MTSFNIGVTVGKFNPPHLGHAHLISCAASQVANLYILVCHKEGQFGAKQRTAWLKAATPDNCIYIITPDDLPEAPAPWAQRTLELINEPINVAFTSEEYGDGWAECLGVQHVCIDLHRNTVPVSASAILDDPAEKFSFLVPAARAQLCKKIVIAGAESSGKTTMAKALADSLNTAWVPEYGRLYCDGRGLDRDWNAVEFEHIASMQTQMINALARHANHGALIIDTDAIVTRVWQRRYLPDSEMISPQSLASHYLICEPVDWVQDGTRESHAYQNAMFSDTVESVEAQNVPYTILKGNHERRLAQALNVIRELTRKLL